MGTTGAVSSLPSCLKYPPRALVAKLLAKPSPDKRMFAPATSPPPSVREVAINTSICLRRAVFLYELLNLISNIIYLFYDASAVADAIRTSLGPKGMDKMVRQF